MKITSLIMSNYLTNWLTNSLTPCKVILLEDSDRQGWWVLCA